MYLYYLFLILCFGSVTCDGADKCYHRTCHECISFDKDCVWCAQNEFEGSRCTSISSLQAGNKWCGVEPINPKLEKKVILNKFFNESIDGVPVQFRPQKILIKARPGETVDFEMQYKLAKDYPLDVYFLMDISYTMKSKINQLKQQATNIYQDLTKYTNNVRLGLGSFIEKQGFPFFDRVEHRSHAFRNHLSLTDKIKDFETAIPSVQKTGSNYDDPEAGLDGLMQVMKCDQEIKWRDGARRFIILCTDSTYHSQGDGKMIGIIKPNDMECHYKNNTFTTEMLLDYPSISQINKVAKDNNFKIIFAATSNVKKVYTELANHIHNAEYAKLDAEGSSVLKIIKNAYEKATRTGELEIRKYDFVKLSTDQVCTIPYKNCELTHGKPLKIKGTLKVTSCTGDKKEIVIKPNGLTDKLIIELETICKCDCKDNKVLSPKCHNAGVTECGVCKCNPGSYGAHCNCTGSSSDVEDFNKCKFPKTQIICNGQGTCSCGECSCVPPFSGNFCEFNDESCQKVKGVICAGHGKCKREECNCDPEWSGSDCTCPLDNKSCKAPYSNEVCSGNGDCKCGKCVCHQNANETYWGEFCDGCDECSTRRCKELEAFVLCIHKHNQTFCEPKLKADSEKTDDEVKVLIVNQTVFDGPNYYMAKRCSALREEDGNYIVFKYFYKDHHLELAIRDEPEAPDVANLLIAVSSAAGLVLLIGIATVIAWKVLMDVHDKREYEKFAADSVAAGFDVTTNPLFVPPAINFTNPVFNAIHDDE